MRVPAVAGRDEWRLPWVPVEEEYRFAGADGRRSLPDHVRPGLDEGCASCSFWADSFDGVVTHLAHRDVTLVCVSRAAYPKLDGSRARMGWSFPWYSSSGSEFNVDFGVSFTPEQQRTGAAYDFGHLDHPPGEASGISAFALEGDRVFHTYSTYSRGLDPINSGYQLLDLAPKGRDEEALDWPMAWLRRHDAYGD